MKNKTKIAIVELIVCIFIVFLFFSVILPLIKHFPKITAYLIQKGYVEIFSGNFNVTLFLAAIFIIVVTFSYISIWCLFFFFVMERKDLRFSTKISKILSDAVRRSIINHKNYFLLIFTFTLSIAFMYTGILFLSTAFPNEPLFVKGVTTHEGSSLRCNGGGYQNIIATYDIGCNLSLAERFDKSVLYYAEIKYDINRTEFKENISSFTKDRVTLNFYKEKQPQFLYLHFTDGKEEVFPLNKAGVFTKKEYFEREKEKAVWFFAIISFSLFSVFSAMNNLKQILKK